MVQEKARVEDDGVVEKNICTTVWIATKGVYVGM